MAASMALWVLTPLLPCSRPYLQLPAQVPLSMTVSWAALREAGYVEGEEGGGGRGWQRLGLQLHAPLQL